MKCAAGVGMLVDRFTVVVCCCWWTGRRRLGVDAGRLTVCRWQEARQEVGGGGEPEGRRRGRLAEVSCAAARRNIDVVCVRAV